jgi:integrase
MTIEKLPSGSYRITQMENGKRFRITLDHKPSKIEAMKLIAEAVEKRPEKVNMTFDDACAAFIDSKANILSPSTKREYGNMRRKIPQDFSKKYLTSITSMDVQKLTNDWSANLAPKTVRNYANFVLAVLKSADIEIKSPHLPQKEKKTAYIPSENDIIAIQEQLKGTEYEIPFFLLCLGLRRSELCALTIDDLNGNTLTINKALVLNESKQWVIKATKTTDSTRTIIIPQDIADKIRERGYVYKGHPANLYDNLRRAQDRAGIPHFKLHALRHFFCSYMHDLGYSDKQIQEMGGWADASQVMRNIYKHAMNMDRAKAEMSAQVSNLLARNRG